jgi:hypothetical protein
MELAASRKRISWCSEDNNMLAQPHGLTPTFSLLCPESVIFSDSNSRWSGLIKNKGAVTNDAVTRAGCVSGIAKIECLSLQGVMERAAEKPANRKVPQAWLLPIFHTALLNRSSVS